MKKTLNKIRKVLIGIGISLISFGTKVFGVKDEFNIQSLYAAPTTPLSKTPIGVILQLIRVSIIPLVLIIGLIYWIKSKNDKKKKAVFIGIVAAVGIWCFIIINVIYNFAIQGHE